MFPQSSRLVEGTRSLGSLPSTGKLNSTLNAVNILLGPLSAIFLPVQKREVNDIDQTYGNGIAETLH